MVKNGAGQMLRIFVDTNADNTVDQWSYYKDGVEVYRDIDSNHNGKADQCRWLNTAGTRWGIDKNEDRDDRRLAGDLARGGFGRSGRRRCATATRPASSGC